MSRVLKFRAWNKEESRLIDLNGFEIAFKGMQKEGEVTAAIEQGNIYMYDTADVEIMQFTGLTDKNGVEIYEGDIYKTTVLAGHPTDRWGGEYWVSVTAKVGFANGRFVGVVVGHTKSSYEPEYKKGHFDGRIAEIKCIEVIGNIHQNPELLK